MRGGQRGSLLVRLAAAHGLHIGLDAGQGGRAGGRVAGARAGRRQLDQQRMEFGGELAGQLQRRNRRASLRGRLARRHQRAVAFLSHDGGDVWLFTALRDSRRGPRENFFDWRQIPFEL